MEDDRDFTFRPIGKISTPWSRQEGSPIQGAFAPDSRGEIEVYPEYAPGLDDVGGFSHIVVLYAFHRTEGFSLRVKPYMDDTERGLFATRAPRRPNPIGVTVVRVLGVKENRVMVSGVDMLDGTPLLDIKPYIPDLDPGTDVRTGWLESRRGEDGDLHASPADDRFDPSQSG